MQISQISASSGRTKANYYSFFGLDLLLHFHMLAFINEKLPVTATIKFTLTL